MLAFMKMMKKRIIFSTFGGILFTILSMAIKWQYCMGGIGYGLPFAILHPSHGNAIFSFNFQPELKTHGMEIDFDNLIFDLVVWFILCLFGMKFYEKFRNRKF